MKTNELTWKKIKELAEMAMKNGYDFSIEIKSDNTGIIVKKSENPTTYIPQTQNVKDIKITYPDTRYPWDNIWYSGYPSWYYDSNQVTCGSIVSGSNATTKLKASTDPNKTETWSVWTTSGYVDTRKEGESK